jgi:hypothetical protein
MPLQLSPHEAASALADIDQARAAMRHVIREHRGHLHFWIWGAIWIAMPLSAVFFGDGFVRHFWIFSVVGIAASGRVAAAQATRVRMPANAQFFGMMTALIVFAALFLLVLRVMPDMKTLYAYICLVIMQSYVVAGLWTDTYLLWVGLLISALILVGLFFFPGIFWLWMAFFGGGSLIGTGFYVRHFWR